MKQGTQPVCPSLGVKDQQDEAPWVARSRTGAHCRPGRLACRGSRLGTRCISPHRSLFVVLDSLACTDGAISAAAQGWLVRALSLGDVARILEPMLLLLLQPKTQRTSIQCLKQENSAGEQPHSPGMGVGEAHTAHTRLVEVPQELALCTGRCGLLPSLKSQCFVTEKTYLKHAIYIIISCGHLAVHQDTKTSPFLVKSLHTFWPTCPLAFLTQPLAATSALASPLWEWILNVVTVKEEVRCVVGVVCLTSHGKHAHFKTALHPVKM